MVEGGGYLALSRMISARDRSLGNSSASRTSCLPWGRMCLGGGGGRDVLKRVKS